MKIQISNHSHQRAKRYSGVYQQQGRMITDADWNELVTIIKERQDAALEDVVGANGSPVDSGVLRDDRLVFGSVYADGLLGEIRRKDNLRLMVASAGKTEEEIIDEFKLEIESKQRQYAILIIRAGNDLEKWTIAGFNDAGVLNLVVIDNPNDVLARELKKDPVNKNRIFELAISALGRTQDFVPPNPPKLWAEDLYVNQQDFAGPPLPAFDPNTNPNPGDTEKFQLYVDVWERLITSLEDHNLLDPGLHGADTCARTQTLAQVKWCQTDPGDETINPKQGDADFSLEINEPNTELTPCSDDPVDFELATSNHLFRLEVHDVVAATNDPRQLQELTLKWSTENAAEAHPVSNVPPYFVQPAVAKAYEFFSDATQLQLGWHLHAVSKYQPPRGELRPAYPDAASLPQQMDKVRRWDGYCRLKKDNGNWVVQEFLDDNFPEVPGIFGGTVTGGLSGDPIKIAAGKLTATLDLAGKYVVAGDFWLARVREHQTDAEQRVQILSHTPVGITHHYVPLGTIIRTYQGPNEFADKLERPEVPTEDSDAHIRRLSFPPLTDIPADHVGYDPEEKDDRWDCLNPQLPYNVQEAIDKLVGGLRAKCVDYDPEEEQDRWDCLNPQLPYNVQDAIDKLVGGLQAKCVDYKVPVCGTEAEPTVRSLLDELGDVDLAGGSAVKVSDALFALLCKLRASEIPLDWERLHERLKKDDIKTVQDALNALAKLIHGGRGCSASVGKDGIFPTLADASNELTGDDFSVCLLPGEHVVSSDFKVERAGEIRICGSAGATVKHDGMLLRGESLKLDGVAFRNNSERGSIVLESDNVSSSGCRFEQDIQRSAFAWSRLIDNSNFDIASDIAVDSQGAVYVAGYSPLPIRIYLKKLDRNGEELWLRNYDNATAFGAALAVAINSDKRSVLIAGTEGARTVGVIFLECINAKTGKTLWKTRLGGDQGSNFPTAIGADESGNVFVTGVFSGTWTHERRSYVAESGKDHFLAMLKSDGTLTGLTIFGGDKSPETSMAVRAKGISYISGQFTGTIDFQSGAEPLLHDSKAGFVARFDGLTYRDAIVLFADGECRVTNLSTGTQGDVVVVGTCSGGLHIHGMNEPPLQTNNVEMFVAKLSADLTTVRWIRRWGNLDGGDLYPTSVTTGPDDAAYVTGYFDNSLNLGGRDLGGGSSSRHAFILRLDVDGAHIWSDDLGSEPMQFGLAVAAARNRVILAGYMRGTADFGGNREFSQEISGFVASFRPPKPQPAVYVRSRTASLNLQVSNLATSVPKPESLVRVGPTGSILLAVNFQGQMKVAEQTFNEDSHGALLLKLGSREWEKHLDAKTGSIFVTEMALDREDGTAVIGRFSGTVDLGGAILSSAGGTSNFVAAFDSAGDHVWSRQFGDTVSLDRGLCVDPFGNVIIAGTFSDTINVGGDDLVAESTLKLFVAKFAPDGQHRLSTVLDYKSDNQPPFAGCDDTGNIYVLGTAEIEDVGSIRHGTIAVSLDASFSPIWEEYGPVKNDPEWGTTSIRVHSMSIDAEGNPIFAWTKLAEPETVEIVKYHGKSGELVSELHLGNMTSLYPVELAAKANGNVLVAARLEASNVFDANPGPVVGTLDSELRPMSSFTIDESNGLVWRASLAASREKAVLSMTFEGKVAIADKPYKAIGSFDTAVLKLVQETDLSWADNHHVSVVPEIRPRPGVALALEHSVGGTLRDNTFDGDILLNSELTETLPALTHLHASISDRTLSTEHSLTIHGNRIHELATRMRPKDARFLEGNWLLMNPLLGYQTLTVCENVFQSNDNTASGSRTILTDNDFRGEDFRLAVFVCDQLAATGNVAEFEPQHVIVTSSPKPMTAMAANFPAIQNLGAP